MWMWKECVWWGKECVCVWMWEERVCVLLWKECVCLVVKRVCVCAVVKKSVCGREKRRVCGCEPRRVCGCENKRECVCTVCVHRWPETRTGETWMTTLFHSDIDSVSQPHQNVPQTGIVHVISHTPPRCGAKGTDAQRQERKQTSQARFQCVEWPTVRNPHVQHWVRGCALQRSLNDWPTFVYRSSAHVSLHKCTFQSPTTEHSLRTLHQVVVAVSTIDRRSISQLTFRLAVCHL